MEKFAPRAAQHDRDASFPTANYEDLRAAGLLAICVPKAHGGLGADYPTYMLTAAEIGRYCGSTALTLNMHVCSCLWTGALADELEMTAAERREHERRRALHYARIVEQGKVYAQPFSEAGPGGGRRRAVRDQGDRDRGRLAGERQEDLRLALRPRRLLRRALHRGQGGSERARHALSRGPGRGRGRPRGRRLGPARHARNGVAQPRCSRTQRSARMRSFCRAASTTRPRPAGRTSS